jgi:hypothetical protein
LAFFFFLKKKTDVKKTFIFKSNATHHFLVLPKLM